ncbi:hypothetical protein XarCFBP6762_07010 [Xanthomonas arboricola]|nr:hypothetical protein XarCFBP6762_07010 [Xanthomonas arboricola]
MKAIFQLGEAYSQLASPAEVRACMAVSSELTDTRELFVRVEGVQVSQSTVISTKLPKTAATTDFLSGIAFRSRQTIRAMAITEILAAMTPFIPLKAATTAARFANAT